MSRPCARRWSRRSRRRASGSSPRPMAARRCSSSGPISPDLVLLDLMLPELSGIEVCRIIRAESGVPIVMLTAKDCRARQGRRPRARRRRLRHQAVQPARADRPASGPCSGGPSSRRPEAAAGPRRPRPGPGRPRRPPPAARRPRRPAQAQGVRAARLPRPPPRPGLHPRPAARARLGLRLRRRDADGRCPRPLAAGADRGRSGNPRVPAHGPRHRATSSAARSERRARA